MTLSCCSLKAAHSSPPPPWAPPPPLGQGVPREQIPLRSCLQSWTVIQPNHDISYHVNQLTMVVEPLMKIKQLRRLALLL